MTTQNERFREALERGHSDLFDESRYEAEFFNLSAGTYDSGEVVGQTRSSIGTTNVEIVPPETDTTIETDGTGLSFATSIRLPEDVGLIEDLIPPGEDNRSPTEVEIQDTVDNSTELYQLHAYSDERGSGFVMIRLEEL